MHNELDLVFRVIRDVFTRDVDKMVIDSPDEYQRVKEFVDSYIPQLSRRVKPYEGDDPIFDHYGVEIEISRALGRKVWLKSGGYIIVDQTEALTAIDVNTGRYVGKRTLEDTILKTNLEAVREIAYQLRLRNIGGIIILDFIDMEREDNRRKVYSALQEALVARQGKDHHLAHLPHRPHRDDQEADPGEPRTHAVRALPLLRRPRLHQVEPHGVLRGPAGDPQGLLQGG